MCVLLLCVLVAVCACCCVHLLLCALVAVRAVFFWFVSDSILTRFLHNHFASSPKGGFAARKALSVVENVEHVLAIEILCACQAIEFFRPLKTTPPLEAVHALVRQHVEPWTTDRHMSPSIDACVKLIRSGEMARVVKPFLAAEEFTKGVKRTAPENLGGDETKKQRIAE